MKRSIAFFVGMVLLLTAVSCANEEPRTEPMEKDNVPVDVTLVLNGDTLDVYTMHYHAREDRVEIPLSAFLQSIGAEYADSPYNAYGTKCYVFQNRRYVFVPDMHLFMLEHEYTAFLKELEEAGQSLSRETTADRGLLPKTERTFPLYEDVVEWAEIWVDSISLMNALRQSGVDITVDYSYSTKTIAVTLP